jgi:nitrate reductase NapAB chaperone NapD
MPVLSYIALPKTGEKNELLKALNSMQFCDAFPADNKDILILVTDTPDKSTDKELHAQLKNLPTLESLSMTFGYNDEQPLEKGDGYEGQ